MCSVLALRAISSRRIDQHRPRGLVSVGLGTRIVRRSSGTVEIESPFPIRGTFGVRSESVGSSYPDPTKTRTRGRVPYPDPQPVDRSGYCSQNKSTTQGKFIVYQFVGHMQDVGAPCVLSQLSSVPLPPPVRSLLTNVRVLLSAVPA